MRNLGMAHFLKLLVEVTIEMTTYCPPLPLYPPPVMNVYALFGRDSSAGPARLNGRAVPHAKAFKLLI
jgi:hypothetical protein